MGNLDDIMMDAAQLTKRFTGLKRKRKNAINLNPLQTAGRVPESVYPVIQQFQDGYSVCDYCRGTLDKIENPPISSFVHEILPRFMGCDIARVTHGAREGKFLIMHAITKPGDTILVDGNRHYSTDMAAERMGLKIIPVPASNDDNKLINVEDYSPLIEEHHPSLILLTWPDGNYGNMPDAKRLGEIAKQHGVPYLLNAAYAIGRMPVDMKEIGADFIVGSAQKSMASMGPSGVLGATQEWEEKLFHISPNYKGKEVECLGCTVRGTPLITMMAAFPTVVERIQNWDEEVAKARWFANEMENLGMKLIGEKPHNHDLMNFETDPFYKIAQTHKKKRAFLYNALSKEGIFGPKQGNTKAMKISTYGTSRIDLQKVLDVFGRLIDENL